MATITTVLDDFVADLKRRHFRPNTITVYRSDLHIAGQHLTLPIAHLTLAAIERFLEEGTFAPATRARPPASLKRFFTWATREGLCAANPLLSREPARSPSRRLPRPIQPTADLEAIDRAITHLTPPIA
jgi:site-specific recombinase XerD